MLLKNIRFYVLVSSFALAILIFLYVQSQYTSSRLQTIRLSQIYALTSTAYLYTALLIGPLLYQLSWIPFKDHILKARRAIGVSAFFFGSLHGFLAFFKQLGGFEGLFFLTDKYLIAISLSFTALMILFFMTLTSVDKVIAWMKFRRWKMLHRFVYLASFFILIHALMLGTHFADLSGTIPQIFSVALAFLLILESIRVDEYLNKKLPLLPRFGFATTILIGLFITYFAFLSLPKDGPVSLGIHAAHIEMAKQSQQQTQTTTQLPGQTGDRTKRFSVDFKPPENIIPRQPTRISFSVIDASNGNQVVSFDKVYEKFVHMIVVNKDLSYFDHVHPEPSGKGFAIEYSFPKNDEYRIYLDFQPTGAIEQQFAFTLPVGDPGEPVKVQLSESELTKSFDQFRVSLQYPKPLKSSLLSIGGQKLNFTITDTSNQPVTNLKPYLGSFGHLVMLNTQTYEYVHVHPTNTTTPKPNDTSGPNVEFMPLGIYSPIKPGVYKIFAQFNPDGNLFTADFIINVE